MLDFAPQHNDLQKTLVIINHTNKTNQPLEVNVKYKVAKLVHANFNTIPKKALLFDWLFKWAQNLKNHRAFEWEQSNYNKIKSEYETMIANKENSDEIKRKKDEVKQAKAKVKEYTKYFYNPGIPASNDTRARKPSFLNVQLDFIPIGTNVNALNIKQKAQIMGATLSTIKISYNGTQRGMDFDFDVEEWAITTIARIDVYKETSKTNYISTFDSNDDKIKLLEAIFANDATAYQKGRHKVKAKSDVAPSFLGAKLQGVPGGTKISELSLAHKKIIFKQIRSQIKELWAKNDNPGKTIARVDNKGKQEEIEIATPFANPTSFQNTFNSDPNLLALFNMLINKKTNAYHPGSPAIAAKQAVQPTFLGIEIPSLVGGSIATSDNKAIILDAIASKILAVGPKAGDVTKTIVQVQGIPSNQVELSTPFDQTHQTYGGAFTDMQSKIALFSAIVKAKKTHYNQGTKGTNAQSEIKPTFLNTVVPSLVGGRTATSNAIKVTILDAIASKILAVGPKAGDVTKTIVQVQGMPSNQVELSTPFDHTHQTYGGAFKTSLSKVKLFDALSALKTQTYNSGKQVVSAQNFIAPSLAGVSLDLTSSVNYDELTSSQKIAAINKIKNLIDNVELVKNNKVEVTINKQKFTITISFNKSKSKTFGFK